MTVDEVRRCIDEGGVIACRDVCRREEALQFLLDIGYEIHPATTSWIESNPGSTDFMHPGLSAGETRLTLWSTTANKEIIAFSAISELIVQCDLPIDSRSSEEFSDAFAELMS